MSILDRLQQPGLGDEVDAIANHTFSAACYMWAVGEVTKANLVSFFGFDSTEEGQLDMIAAYYQGLGNAEKVAFHGRLESCGILFETGAITKAQYKSFLGIS